mmetsp:Transcript_2031/g.2961  ORF Transcript_2031/g.2961 Transcript_2031/m.2961 type:complete len:96 (-) Transcript_2031:169-456(-)
MLKIAANRYDNSVTKKTSSAANLSICFMYKLLFIHLVISLSLDRSNASGTLNLKRATLSISQAYWRMNISANTDMDKTIRKRMTNTVRVMILDFL